MDFKSDAQRTVYEKISPWLHDIFGESAIPRDDVPATAVVEGSTFATTAVYPWGQDDATITTRAYVVTGAELTPDLMKYLLNENASMRFGAFGVDNDGDIFFEHTIVGSTCDKEELRSSVKAVVWTADQYDDKIVERWGGKRALDRR